MFIASSARKADTRVANALPGRNSVRFFILAAALMASASAAVPPATAQTPVTAYVLRLSIVTGDDDLRGGQDNVRGSFRIGSTWSAPVVLNRRGQRWPDRSRNTAELRLPPDFYHLNAVRLETSFSGGMGGDNWNMDQLYIEVCPVPRSAGQCTEIGRHGQKRFTASEGTLVIPVVSPSARDADRPLD